MAERGETK